MVNTRTDTLENHFSAWLLEKEKLRKAELEEMVADKGAFVDFLERKVRGVCPK